MSLVTQIVGFLLWLFSLVAFWHAYATRRKLPVTLILPGYVACLPLAFMLRGILGDASLALPALCLLAGSDTRINRSGQRLLAAVLVAALALAMSALGLMTADLYAPGYAPGLLVILIAGIVIAAYQSLPVLGWSWLLGLGLSASGLHPSPNVWDVLIDVPSILLIAAILFRQRRSGITPDAVSVYCGSASTAPSGSNRQEPD